MISFRLVANEQVQEVVPLSLSSSFFSSTKTYRLNFLNSLKKRKEENPLTTAATPLVLLCLGLGEELGQFFALIDNLIFQIATAVLAFVDGWDIGIPGSLLLLLSFFVSAFFTHALKWEKDLIFD